MSSVVNKSKNKFVPKVKARPRLGAPIAPPTPHFAPAPLAPLKPVEEPTASTTLKSNAPEIREKTPAAVPTGVPTAVPTVQVQPHQEQQNGAHEPSPRPRSGIPGLRTTSTALVLIPGMRVASEEEQYFEPASRPRGIPAIQSSGARNSSSSTDIPVVGSAATIEENIVGGGADAETSENTPQVKGRPKRARIKGKIPESNANKEEREEQLPGEGGEEEEGTEATTEDSEFVQQSQRKKTPRKRKPKTPPGGELPTKKKATSCKKRPPVGSSGSGDPIVDEEGMRERGVDGSEASAAPKIKKERAPVKARSLGTPRSQGTAKPRGRCRAESPEDGEAQEIAISVVKMKDLCRDMRIGKKSKRFFELQQMDFTKLAREQGERAERERRIQNGEEEGGEGHETTEQRLERLANERSRRTMNAPQMRIVNGQIVLDDESLHIDRRERDAVDESIMEVVEENQNSRLVNSQTWSKREKVEKWDAASTERFYEALSMFGTDFEIISRMFAGRSRRQMRNKFNNEERKHPERITAALRTRVSVNIEEYSVMADQQFSEPQELEDELQKLREAHEADELAAAGHAVAMEKERQEVANALMHEGDNAVVAEQGKKTRKKKGTKGKTGAGQEEEVLTMTREEYEAERARELAEAEDI